jgi:hypothetical protein
MDTTMEIITILARYAYFMLAIAVLALAVIAAGMGLIVLREWTHPPRFRR